MGGIPDSFGGNRLFALFSVQPALNSHVGEPNWRMEGEFLGLLHALYTTEK